MLSLIVFILAGLLGPAGEWPQFRGNPHLTGVAPTAAPRTLKLLWTYEAGESIESSAAIAGGTVYVGVESGDLLAIDLQTGKLRWRYRAVRMASANRHRPFTTAWSISATSRGCSMRSAPRTAKRSGLSKPRRRSDLPR